MRHSVDAAVGMMIVPGGAAVQPSVLDCGAPAISALDTIQRFEDKRGLHVSL